MPIALRELRTASERPFRELSLEEARRARAKTAFLCHSHHDKSLVTGLVTMFRESGWALYVDWRDTTLPNSPNRQTAEKIQLKVTQSDLFLFLATPKSMASRWCPWEIGFADGVRNTETILIIPTIDDSGNWHGNEYLQLYRKLDWDKLHGFAVSDPGSSLQVSVRAL